MAWWIPVAIAASTLLQVEGQKQQGEAARREGQRRRIAAEFEAAQLEQQAGQSIAVSQRQALDVRRQARLVQSRALALAAASGGGASDPTVVRIMADIAGEGAYRAQVALYGGLEEARRLRMGAKAKRYGGAMAEEAGIDAQRTANTLAVATAFSGAANTTMAARYGGTRPPSGSLSGGLLDAGTPSFSSYG